MWRTKSLGPAEKNPRSPTQRRIRYLQNAGQVGSKEVKVLVSSDEFGDELRDVRSMLFGSLGGEEKLRRLEDRYCSPRDAAEVRETSEQPMVAASAGERTTPPL
jgi:hypothetical protein